MSGALRIARESYQITSVDPHEVMRYLGYQGQELSEDLSRRIAQTTARCLELARPRGCISTFRVSERSDDAVVLEGCALALTGHDISAHLADATEVALFAVTLGADVDRELRRLSLTDALGQVVLDAAATALVERAADAAEAHVRSYAADMGAFASWRFSPGYGDLSLAIQGTFLSVLDATRQLGITLTPSDLMVPTKSVTAIVGIHPTPQPDFVPSCSACNLAEFCTIRTTGRTCREP